MHLGDVPAGETIPIPFSTRDATGASVTLTGLAVTDIEIYKDGGTTQRASDSGYSLLDTDGIDFDGITGIHGFSVDLSDDTDSGFYAVGSWYWVVVSSITVDSQTVSFIAATFRIVAAEANAGYPKVDTEYIEGSDATDQVNAAADTAISDAALATATALATAQADLDTLTGADGVTLATAQGNYAPAKAGDQMNLADDAITSGKYDELTAFPVASTDSGSTQIARVGADGDTLETLSDQLDGGALEATLGTPAGASMSADIAALPTAAENATELLDQSAGVETGLTVRQAFRLFASALLGKVSGMGSNAPVFRDTGDSKDRITATTDADGNRSAVTLDGT